MTPALTRLRRMGAAMGGPADRRSLAEKLVVSGALTTLEQVLTLAFRIGSTLIVTRLLAPDIFGLFALIVTIQIVLALVTDFGVREMILTAPDATRPAFLRTCWSVQVLRGVAIFALVLALALVLHLLQRADVLTGAHVYAAQALPAALALSGLQMVIQGFESVNIHVDAREMRFGRIAALNLVQAGLAPVLTILIALEYPTIWALVAAGLVTAAIRLALSHLMFRGPAMGFSWDRDTRAALIGRGKWIMGRSALFAMTREADRLILGVFLPAPLFGVYFLARQIFTVPEALVQKLHASFGLQVFREIMTRAPGAMRAGYYAYRRPMDAVTCLFAGGFLTAAPAVISVMYDPRYQEAGQILQILALGLPLIGAGMMREAFGARQRFRITAGFGLVQAVTIWIGLAVALMVLESVPAAFAVIALHRIPEIALLLAAARREGWVDLLGEVRMVPLIGVGAMLGWGLSALIGSLTG